MALKHDRTSVITPFVDFWLLGGASIVLWAVMQLGQVFRERSDVIDHHFLQVGAVFSLMAIFFNNPHFIIGYRFGYGRGAKFVTRHWFPLIAVPLGLISLYAFAYFNFGAQISEFPSVLALNAAFVRLGLGFRLGTLSNLGTEILSLSVLLMNITVGWHYSKQVFGCVMVYAKYDRYPISRFQRSIIKYNLFAVAFLNFFSLTVYYAPEYSVEPLTRAYFFNVPMIPLGLPSLLVPISAVAVGVLAAMTLGFVFYDNYRKYSKLPSLNLVVPWVAFHVWWLPFYRQTEFYFATIPFFHSLQYLPFAYRMEEPHLRARAHRELRTSLFLAVLLFAGFCAFELVPGSLDYLFHTMWHLGTWFFLIAFAVFLNVHHFFIDSVIWKFDQKEMREGVLSP